MPNLSPSDSISVLTTKTKTTKRNTITKEKEKQSNNLPLKKSNTTNFQKLFFSNNQTQQPKRNNEINKCKTHLGFCLDRIAQVLLELLGSNQTKLELLELIGSDQWFSLTLSCSISLVPHRSSPGFCSGRIGPGFCWS